MKKLILLLLLVTTSFVLFSQNMAGGIWIGSNQSTTLIGFVGPKLSYSLQANQKTKIEIGLNGIPGLIIRPETKLGLSIGGTITIKIDDWNIKPVIGVMFVKTSYWQALPGIGIIF